MLTPTPYPTGPLPAMVLPLLGMRVSCGFPSPAEDHLGEDLDLNQHCISNPLATFYATAEGTSMEGFGIHHGDTLIVDRSITAKDGDTALVLWDGGFMVKKLRIRGQRVELRSGNPDHPPILVPPESELMVWGVITWSFHPHTRRK